MSIRFLFQSPINVSETQKETFIEGVLISEGLSLNGNYYTFESLRSIAESAVGKSVHFGVTSRILPNGLRVHNIHDLTKEPVGKIVKTWFNKSLRKVFFKALLTSKEIAETVREGWGISIDGWADGGFVKKMGRLIFNVTKVLINNVQLFSEKVVRGVQSARVESIVQESLAFVSSRNKVLPVKEIITALWAQGVFD